MDKDYYLSDPENGLKHLWNHKRLDLGYKTLQIVSSNCQFILQLKLGGPTVPTLLLNYSSPRLMGYGRRILQILLPPPSAELRIRRAVGAKVQSSPSPEVLTGLEAKKFVFIVIKRTLLWGPRFLQFHLVQSLVQYKFPDIVQFFVIFSWKTAFKSTFCILSTSPRLVQFLNNTIPREHKIRTIRRPPVVVGSDKDCLREFWSIPNNVKTSLMYLTKLW